MNRCMGCGVLLQTKDKNKIGYIPKEKMNKVKLCERCFRLLHYNDLQLVDLPKSEEVIKIVNKKGGFVFFLVDLLNINKESINAYKSINIPKCLILSKVDFIPKYLNKDNIKLWLKKEYGVKEDIIFVSALKSFNIRAINNYLVEKSIDKAYLVGFTNSGKSTLVNSITKENNITTSILPNTTLDFMNIKLENNKTLIDTPGFLYKETLYDKNDIVFIKKINPKTFIKPVTYQLKKGASIIIENFIRIEAASDKCNLTIYMSNLLDIKRVYEKNDLFYNLEKINISIDKNKDIVLKGIGFINCKSKGLLNIYIKNKSFIEVRNSFFKEVSL